MKSLDDSEPLDWREALIKAAQEGDPRAQRMLADRLRVGDDSIIRRDYGEALRWYRRAAEQGDAAGQNDLGSMYLNALGVEKDAAEAARWSQVRRSGTRHRAIQLRLALALGRRRRGR
jgi:TPR repeat protein